MSQPVGASSGVQMPVGGSSSSQQQQAVQQEAARVESIKNAITTAIDSGDNVEIDITGFSVVFQTTEEGQVTATTKAQIDTILAEKTIESFEVTPVVQEVSAPGESSVGRAVRGAMTQGPSGQEAE